MEESSLLLPPSSGIVPKDRLFIVYGLFYLLGVGVLLPWNFFSTAKQYFMFKLRNTTLPASFVDNPSYKTELQASFEGYLAVAAMTPNVIFMFLNTAATKLIRLKVRMVMAGILMIAFFCLTLALSKVDTDAWQGQFFGITLATIVGLNACSAVLQGGIFGLASMFPKNYTQSVMGGMGMGGIIAAVGNIIAIWAAGTPVDSGFGYFMTGVAVLVVAFIGYLCMPLSQFAQYYLKHPEAQTRERLRYDSKVGHKRDNGKDKDKTTTLNPDSQVEDAEKELERSGLAHSTLKQHSSRVPLLDVFKKVWMYGLSVFFIFFVTLACYPAVLSNVVSVSKEPTTWTNTYFGPVVCFLFFNVGDYMGRTLAGFVQVPRDGSLFLPILAILRVAFIPLFLLCNVQPRYQMPVVFNSDVAPMVMMWPFAISNGYLGTLCMMYGPKRVIDEDLEMAGSLMSFFLASGLGLGSVLSLALVKVV